MGWNNNTSRPLTPRQYQVATLISLGLTNKEIARMLSISPYTVQDTIADISLRCGVRGRAAVAMLAQHNGQGEELHG